MTTVFQVQLDGRFTEIKNNLKRMKLYRTKQGSNFRGSFSKRDQFRRKILKDGFPSRRAHFHINSTRVIKPIKQNKLSFSSKEINKPLPAPFYRSRGSDSSSNANFSCCHKSVALSHLEQQTVVQKHIQEPVRHQIWSVLLKKLTTKNLQLFSKNSPSQMFDSVLNTPQQYNRVEYNTFCSGDMFVRTMFRTQNSNNSINYIIL